MPTPSTWVFQVRLWYGPAKFRTRTGLRYGSSDAATSSPEVPACLHAARHDCRHGRAIPAPTDAAPLWPGVLANATTALQRRRAADIPEALRRVASVVVHARSAEAPPAAAAQQFLRALGKAVPMGGR